MRVITFGTFDVFHVGHVNILERARLHGDHLIVGVSSDALNMAKKKRYPIYSEKDRMHIIRSMRSVDEVFVEESLELKAEYIKYYNADILVMGDDWQGKFDHLKDICQVIYLPRTPSVSTTEIIEIVKTDHNP
ncbi:glycerol-3-phosphate cytidylyltransferase [Thalassotalea litorea]|uniref:Glycerol-3-phosphate cytidylyltransferase n=2 Tax=Thalassotalea litorea TaxID=2020715 RepID=A0A5R9INZ7_9GAMM|nr:glycerol-3-phosphate cytidylyltransferase [Thalassotalea litorea]